MNNIYDRAEQRGVEYECNCTNCGGVNAWEELMKGATRANKIKVVKIALQAGVIDQEQARQEIKRPHYNPYNHFKTKTHIVYVHSSIEYFIRIN